MDLMENKKEYIDALNRMEEAYFNSDNSSSAMDRFNKDINLLAGLVKEHFDDENQIKFYYCESEGSYLIGKQVGNFYYARWHENLGFVFEMSKYLPWGKHIVDPDTLWKEHTYPSKPVEVDFYTWIKGFVKKNK